MKVFITGASGLVGSRFVDLSSKKYDFITPEFPDFDLTKATPVRRFMDKVEPRVVVHFAAHTNLNEAEEQRGDKKASCWMINDGQENIL